MILRVLLLGLAVLLGACSRSSVAGVYETFGDTSKFQMVLELNDGGGAKLTTRTQLGGKTGLDQAVQASLNVPNGRWEKKDNQIVVTGDRPGTDAGVFRFVVQPNGDLVWAESGARFVRKAAAR